MAERYGPNAIALAMTWSRRTRAKGSFWTLVIKELERAGGATDTARA